MIRRSPMRGVRSNRGGFCKESDSRRAREPWREDADWKKRWAKLRDEFEKEHLGSQKMSEN